MQPNIIDLQSELSFEFLSELARSKNRSWAIWSMFWYGARSSPLAAVVANLPGVKLMVSVDSPRNLSKLVARAFLFADHVVIRHQSLIRGGSDFIAGAPMDFDYDVPHWIKKHDDKLDKLLMVPHFKNAPYDIEPFFNWCLNQGRPWIENGLVTYAPFFPLQQLEMASNKEKSINLNYAFTKANVFPQSSGLMNEKAAKAIWSIPFPYLDGIKPETLLKIKEDHKDALDNFHASIINAVKHLDCQQESDELDKEIKLVYNDVVRAGVAEVDKSISSLKRMAFLRSAGVTVEFGIATLGFFLGVPPIIDVAGVSKAVWDLSEAIAEHNNEYATIKDKPMYVLTRLRKANKRN